MTAAAAAAALGGAMQYDDGGWSHVPELRQHATPTSERAWVPSVVSAFGDRWNSLAGARSLSFHFQPQGRNKWLGLCAGRRAWSCAISFVRGARAMTHKPAIAPTRAPASPRAPHRGKHTSLCIRGAPHTSWDCFTTSTRRPTLIRRYFCTSRGEGAHRKHLGSTASAGKVSSPSSDAPWRRRVSGPRRLP